MTACRSISSVSDLADASGVWQYSRPGGRAMELGTVCGRGVALPLHFHDEDQIVFVLVGTRRLIIGDEQIAVGPDEGIRIPAGVPHRSVSDADELFCFNIYALPDTCALDDLLACLASWRRRTGQMHSSDLVHLFEQHQYPTVPQSKGTAATPQILSPTVSEAAGLSGMSREGFSRRFRRLHGMSPQQFLLMEKLNEARHLLRIGTPVADAAAQAGFADQSHLGRLFRRAFGVTPGRYRAG